MTFGTFDAPRRRWPVILSTVGLHAGVLLSLIPGTFSWGAVGAAALLYYITIGLGIALGFHRLASHRSLRLPKWLEYSLILCGTLAAQGGVIGWVGYHRLHHRHTDQRLDPHDSTQGFWWSHISWLMHEVPSTKEMTPQIRDIVDDPFYRFCHRHYVALQLGLAVLLYALGGLSFVVWGIFVRLFIGFHSTCCVNSVCHMFGYRSHEVPDRSTNCWWVALLTFGEGWHNNHHAYQASAQTGTRWWEIDLTWQTVRLLRVLGWATHVKTSKVTRKSCHLT
ncbi:MAG: acyl-CoA desaturase [Elainellaceae cyanobacterium]